MKLEQNYRNFDYESPWEGTKYIKEEIDNNDKMVLIILPIFML